MKSQTEAVRKARQTRELLCLINYAFDYTSPEWRVISDGSKWMRGYVLQVVVSRTKVRFEMLVTKHFNAGKWHDKIPAMRADIELKLSSYRGIRTRRALSQWTSKEGAICCLALAESLIKHPMEESRLAREDADAEPKPKIYCTPVPPIREK